MTALDPSEIRALLAKLDLNDQWTLLRWVCRLNPMMTFNPVVADWAKRNSRYVIEKSRRTG